MKRKRLPYFFIILFLVVLGPYLRSISNVFPEIINLVLGDIIYALAVYFVLGSILNEASSKTIGLYALAFCFVVEVSQLYQAPWIDSIRTTRIGGYILGFGFLWSDLLAYLIGVCMGILLEFWWRKNRIFGNIFYW